MGDRTAIPWTDSTLSFLTGCKKVSEGCKNCYMYRIYPRLKAMGVRGYSTSPDTLFIMEDRIRVPLHWRRGRKIFPNSMSDTFHELVPYWLLDDFFDVMDATPQHIYQLLTKRPGNMLNYARHRLEKRGKPWPANAWAGVSVENQLRTSRIAPLMALRHLVSVLWVSYEPALGAVDFGPWMEHPFDWLVIGGESGHERRSMDLGWMRAACDVVSYAKIPVFVKQDSGPRAGMQGRIPDDLWALKEFPGP